MARRPRDSRQDAGATRFPRRNHAAVTVLVTTYRWGRREVRPRFVKPARSENKLQAELNRARASRTHGRVGGGEVGSGTAATEASHGRIIEAVTILSAVWIGEVGMVEYVEELSPELGAEALAEMPVLRQREVHVAETRIGEGVAAHVAERPQCRRNHD